MVTDFDLINPVLLEVMSFRCDYLGKSFEFPNGHRKDSSLAFFSCLLQISNLPGSNDPIQIVWVLAHIEGCTMSIY